MKNGTRHVKATPAKLAPPKLRYGPSCEKCKHLTVAQKHVSGRKVWATVCTQGERVLSPCDKFTDASTENHMGGGLLGVKFFRA